AGMISGNEPLLLRRCGADALRRQLGRYLAADDVFRRRFEIGLRSLQAEVNLRSDQDHTQRDEYRADRPLDEDEDIAARDQHGAAEVFLEPRAEHKPEQ